MYNLLVVNYDDAPNYWENNATRWVRALPQGWGLNRMPGRERWDELRKRPCLFTYELKPPAVVGHIGEIVDVDFPDIKYELEDSIEISRDCLRDLGFKTGDEHRTQWIEKEDVDLYKVVTKWRREECNVRPLPTEAEKRRVWGNDYLWKPRLFLSHRAAYRSKVSQVKVLLEHAGGACFVAHDDIEPGSIWHDEIIHALDTMQVFIGFITDDFHTGGWPDQEVGYAHQRGIPKVFLKLGQCDPRGAVAIEQALSANWNNAVAKLILHLRESGLMPKQGPAWPLPKDEDRLPWEPYIDEHGSFHPPA